MWRKHFGVLAMYFIPYATADQNPYGVEPVQPEAVLFENGRTARSEARTERPAFEAVNSAFFDTTADRGFFHQRRSSTADESTLVDSVE